MGARVFSEDEPIIFVGVTDAGSSVWSLSDVARDPPFPASVSATSQIPVRPSLGANVYKTSMRSSTLSADLPDVTSSQVPISTDVGKGSLLGSMNHEASSALVTSYTAKRFPMTYERLSQRSSLEESNDIKAPRRVLKLESTIGQIIFGCPI